jgi:hypothetical protein
VANDNPPRHQIGVRYELSDFEWAAIKPFAAEQII